MENTSKLSEVLPFLPQHFQSMIKKLPWEILNSMEEIRLRQGKPLMVVCSRNDYFVSGQGLPVTAPHQGYSVTEDDLRNAVQLVCNFSFYSVEEELKNGFVTISGGHRVGICGKTILENGRIKTIRDISFLNYRIARQVLGAADPVISHVIRSPGLIYNTLILSPPQCGKTTILRDLVRQLSNGIGHSFAGCKVGLVDERSEIAAASFGIPKNDVGVRTDVLDSCPKAEGIIMMIRSMSPDIIATDEIGKAEDADAVVAAVNAGVKLVTTIHGSGMEDFFRKQDLKRLHTQVFERYIILSRRQGPGTIEAVMDGDCGQVGGGNDT